jgi:hypothetical protein
MSTRRKGSKSGIDIFTFVNRREIPQAAKDRFSLSLRLYRNAIAAHEGTIAMWTDLAGMVNVGGMMAGRLRKPELIEELNRGSTALNSILARNERVGGRVAATAAEADDISAAINCLEARIWPHMTVDDFMHIGAIFDAQNAHLKDIP